jgi:hypothetical protein
MKKALGFLKSNIMIFIGALLLLQFMNYLALRGTTLALGIFATLIGLYYIAIGVLGIFIGDKLNALTRKIFDVVAISLFAFLMFLAAVFNLVSMIQESTDPQFPQTFGPTAWFIAIFTLLTALALAGFYPFARLFKNEGLKRLGLLFSALFALGLLLDQLFDFTGFAITLGQIQFVYIAVDLLFVIYLFDSFGDAKEEPKAIPQKAQPKEEKAEEPAPQEEAPAEEPKSEE